MAEPDYNIVYDETLDRFVIPVALNKISAVYLIENAVSKSSYVGSSKTVGKRISRHLNGISQNRPIAFDLACYGRRSFSVSILEIVSDETDLDQRETHWICQLNPTNNTIRSGSHGRHSFSNEARDKISSSNKMRRHSEETKRKIGLGNSRMVKIKSDSEREAVSKALKMGRANRRLRHEAIASWMLAVMSYLSKKKFQ